MLPFTITKVPRLSAVVAVAYLATAGGQVLLSHTPLATGAAIAQQQKQEQQTRKTPAMRNPVYEKLAKAQEAVEAKDYAAALKVLDDMKSRHDRDRYKLNSYEVANLYATYAFIYYTQEKYNDAIRANEMVIRQPEIPLGLEINTRYTIAQLYFVVEKYPQAVKALENWFKVEPNPSPDAYMLLAQGYYQLKQYNKALNAVERGMKVAENKGREPKEQWYLLMRALYFEKDDNRKVAWTLEELVKRWPKKQYFVQLSNIYAQLNNTRRQLSAHDIAYTGYKLDKESELLNMGYLYMGNDIPYQGAQVLEKGLKSKLIRSRSRNYLTLSQAYTVAQENAKALPHMETAAKLADNGETWARLADVYYDSERYKDALKAAQTALKKGGVKRPENTYVIMGMTLFNLDRFDEAKTQFRKAQKSKNKSTAKTAGDWLKYIDSEVKRRKALEEV